MAAALLGLAPGVFIGVCTSYLLHRGEHERDSIIGQATKEQTKRQIYWMDIHFAVKEESGGMSGKVAQISQTGHSNPKFSCEHDDVKANAPNPDVCEARKKDITDYVLEREQKLFAHSRLVGWRTAGLIALAVASFFLSIRLAPSIVAASKSMHRAYIICAAGSILAGFVIPNLYRL